MKPKEKKLRKVDWEVSEHTIDLVKVYSEYTDYSETEVIEFFLKYIREDNEFRNWIMNKRNNKKLLRLLDVEETHTEKMSDE